MAAVEKGQKLSLLTVSLPSVYEFYVAVVKREKERERQRERERDRER